MRSRAKVKPEPEPLPEAEETVRPPSTKPFFSLSTNRTFGSTESPRPWVAYQAVNQMDFRVYQVKDTRKFFTELKDPHQMGKDEEEEVVATLPKKKQSFLNRVRSVKRWAHTGLKRFVRLQLPRDSRTAFNQKFRKDEDPVRTPLNVADYARVPLLNPDMLVTSWREELPPLEILYDKRMIRLGKQSPCVYLVEAVYGDLCSYTVVVFTDLSMIDKNTHDVDM